MPLKQKKEVFDKKEPNAKKFLDRVTKMQEIWLI